MALIQLRRIRSYLFPIILMGSILLGGLVGYFFGAGAERLKPLGDIFLNLIFAAIVPLIFFSVSSAVARVGSLKKLGILFFYMMMVFIVTGTIASILSIIIVKLFPLGLHVHLPLLIHDKITTLSDLNQTTGVFTVPEFSKLLSSDYMLALIFCSLLVGIAVSSLKENNIGIVSFLTSGEALFMRIFSLIMYVAPIGFFAYFAALVSELGPKLMQSYLYIAEIYYIFSICFFVCIYTIYAYVAGKNEGMKLFWKNILLPMATAIATCSSAASIAANLVATKNMRVPPEIYETTIPLGTIIHKEGSVMGGIFKIAFLFGIYHMDFTGASVLLTALGVSLLVGTVMGAIPSGGMIGELLILSLYGFPPSTLFVIAAISIIIDPLATMLNVTGNTISSMLIARLVRGKAWMVSLSLE